MEQNKILLNVNAILLLLTINDKMTRKPYLYLFQYNTDFKYRFYVTVCHMLSSKKQ